jgi:hypothetical protein
LARFPISIQIRFLRVPTQWTVRESQWGWTLVPEIDQDMERKISTLDEPWAIRNDFLRLKHTEEAALKFLTKIGIWNAVEDHHATKASCGKMLLAGYFGHQLFFGRATFVPLEEFWARQAWWKNLLSDPNRLLAEFSPPSPAINGAPFEKAKFAANATAVNTLRLHIDWQQRKRRQADGNVTTAMEPQGIVQPFTFHDLLVATAHVDLLTGAQIQICECCGIPFTGRERKFCCWYCGHLQSVRRGRNKRRKEKEKRGKKR